MKPTSPIGPGDGLSQQISRRDMLSAGAGVLLTSAACSTQPTANASPRRGHAAEARAAPPVTIDRVHSPARGRDVDLVVMRPEGVPAADLPVCVALHGRGLNAREFLGLGVPQQLSQAVRAGLPPFAVAAVDGAHYWVQTEHGDDPQRMLWTELPGWLRHRGLARGTGGVPSAVLGISMGGFGALCYARSRLTLSALAVCSPALFRSWPDARARKVFHNRLQWEVNEPLHHLGPLPTTAMGVWCGTEDPFAPAARRLAAEKHPRVAEFTRGRHTSKYWKSVMPSVVHFLGEQLA